MRKYYIEEMSYFEKLRVKSIKSETHNDICNDLFNDKYVGFFLGLSITCIVLTMNYILIGIVYNLVNYIGYSTKSDEMGAIMKILFFGQFTNTGIIILIIHLNLSEH